MEHSLLFFAVLLGLIFFFVNYKVEEELDGLHIDGLADKDDIATFQELYLEHFGMNSKKQSRAQKKSQREFDRRNRDKTIEVKHECPYCKGKGYLDHFVDQGTVSEYETYKKFSRVGCNTCGGEGQWYVYKYRVSKQADEGIEPKNVEYFPKKGKCQAGSGQINVKLKYDGEARFVFVEYLEEPSFNLPEWDKVENANLPSEIDLNGDEIF